MHAIKNITDKNSAPSDKSCRSLRVWHVIPILEVSFPLLGYTEAWVGNYLNCSTTAQEGPSCQASLKLTKLFPLQVR